MVYLFNEGDIYGLKVRYFNLDSLINWFDNFIEDETGQSQRSHALVAQAGGRNRQDAHAHQY
jgi:hypothetical protein